MMDWRADYEWRHAMADRERAAEAGENRTFPPPATRAPRREHVFDDLRQVCVRCAQTKIRALHENVGCRA